MPKINEAIIRVYLKEDINTSYKIFIDNEEVSKYEFSKTNDSYGYKDIRIEVIEGRIMIPFDSSIAEYPETCNGPKFIGQHNYVNWLYSVNISTDIWYNGIIEYKHIWAQGATYFENGKAVILHSMEMFPSEDPEKNTSKLLKMLKIE